MGTGMALAGLIPASGHGQNHGGMGRRQARTPIRIEPETAGVCGCSGLREAGHGLCPQTRGDATQGVQHQPAGMGLQGRFGREVKPGELIQNRQQLSVHVQST